MKIARMKIALNNGKIYNICELVPLTHDPERLRVLKR